MLSYKICSYIRTLQGLELKVCGLKDSDLDPVDSDSSPLDLDSDSDLKDSDSDSDSDSKREDSYSDLADSTTSLAKTYVVELAVLI